MSPLPDVVIGAGGLRIAQRHATDPAPADLRVGRVAPIVVPDQPALEAQRAGGAVWRRHWDLDEGLVIDFVEVAVVEVDAAGTVTFDRTLPAELEQHLLLDHVLPLVLARGGALVVHGGVISREGDGVVLLGSSGAGKSTLTAFAWQRGWTVGGDDGAVLTAGPPPTAEPTYPTVRLGSASVALLGLDPRAGTPVAGKLRLAGPPDQPFSRHPVPLRLLAIVTPGAPSDAAVLEPVMGAEAHAELFGSTFHADLKSRRHLPGIVDDLARIAETTMLARLVVPRGRAGLEAAEATLRAAISTARPRSDA